MASRPPERSKAAAPGTPPRSASVHTSRPVSQSKTLIRQSNRPDPSPTIGVARRKRLPSGLNVSRTSTLPIDSPGKGTIRRTGRPEATSSSFSSIFEPASGRCGAHEPAHVDVMRPVGTELPEGRVMGQRGDVDGRAQPAQVMPLEAAQVGRARPRPMPLQQVAHPGDIARLPGLLGQLHVRGVQRPPQRLPGRLGLGPPRPRPRRRS